MSKKVIDSPQVKHLTHAKWIISGLVSFAFGFIGAGIAYQLERIYDENIREQKRELTLFINRMNLLKEQSAKSSKDEKRVKTAPLEIKIVAWLVILRGTHLGQVFTFYETATIGRDASECDVALDDLTASGIHARIKLHGNEFIIRDLDSTNGTFVNSEKILELVLHDGDNLTIGKHLLAFKCVGIDNEQD